MPEGRAVSFPARLPGEKNPNAKLSSVEVQDIRRLYDVYGNMPRRAYGRLALHQIGLPFGVSHETVRQIGLRRTWSHLPEEP